MARTVTLDVGRALAELDATPAARWRGRFKRILMAIARDQRGVDAWADEMLDELAATEKRRAEISEKRRAAGVASGAKRRTSVEQPSNMCSTSVEQVLSKCSTEGAPSEPPPTRNPRESESAQADASLIGTNSQKATLSSFSSCRPLPPPSSLPAGAGAGGSAAPTAAGGKGLDVGTLKGSPYEGLEEAIRRSPMPVGKFLQVATAGCLRREQAEEWVRTNEAGSWTTTSASGIERTMTANEAAKRLASFCTSVRRVARKSGAGRKADNFHGVDEANEEKFRRLAGG